LNKSNWQIAQPNESMTRPPSSRFDIAHLQADLKGHTVRGGIKTFGAQGFGFILNVASVAILARLLTPYDFGLIAMVTAATGLLVMFKDAGLSMATVQQETVTHEQVSTLFWVNVGLSLVLMLFVAALSPWVATFYNEPKLQPITLVIACMFIFDGLAVQHQALLRRQMQFGKLAKIQIVSSALGITTAISAALMGAGYWALIVQIGVVQSVSAAFTWCYARWLPGRPQRGVGTRNMFKFGGYLTAFNFVNYFARYADKVLIGNAWGSSALGLYTKAYSLLLMPLQQINGPITAVAIPALSRLQNDPEQFRVFFIKVLSIISFVTFPLIAWMIVCSTEIILVFLGPQWDGAISIFAVLSISAFFQPIGNITGVLYIALGRTKRMFNWGLMGFSWLLLSFFVGLPYGAVGVASSYSVATALMTFPLIWYAIQGTSIRFSDFYLAVKIPVVATLLISIVGLFMSFALKHSFPWVRLLLTSGFMMASYVLFTYKANPKLILFAYSAIKTKGKSLN
jgi:PST family polysaccharide transporter